MKSKEYEKLLDKIEEAYNAYGSWRLEIADYNPADGNYSYEQLEEERDKAEVILDKYKAQLEEILTVDMETFAKDILEYINETHDKEYEVMVYNIIGEKLWVAKPKGKMLGSTNKIIDELEDVYVLGKNDKKVLPKQYFEIETITFPTVHVVNNKYFYAYHKILGALIARYDKFDKFMDEYEDKLVEAYVPKKKNKR